VISRFPPELLTWIRCPGDGGPLAARSDAVVACGTCAADYPLRDGVLDLLGETGMDAAESQFELQKRAEQASQSRGSSSFQPTWADELEVQATLRKLGDLLGKKVIELGCGPGFYTRHLVELGAVVLALDFSAEALKLNASQLPAGARVGLVRADVSRLRLSPAVFDLALTTLYSNLPTAQMRRAANQAVHQGLKPGGQYLVSAHHQDLRRVVRRRPLADHYPGSGIFFQNFSQSALRRELSESFQSVATTPVCIWIPVLSRVSGVRSLLSRASERLPVLNRFGLIVLATATRTAA
jgi:SAM-dependent methyltransferase